MRAALWRIRQHALLRVYRCGMQPRDGYSVFVGVGVVVATAIRTCGIGVTTVTIFRMRRVLLPAIVALALSAGSAAAQQEVPDAGGRVYGLVGGAFGDGAFVATGAGAGLRLTRHLGLDVELTHLSGRDGVGVAETLAFSSVSTAGTAFDEDYPPVPSFRVENHGRDVTTFLTKFTVEFPIADGLLFPYLTGGGGVGRVTEHSRVVVEPVPLISWEDNQTTGRAADFPTLAAADGTVYFSDISWDPTSYSELGLALTLGGGVDVRLWRGLGVGVDIRWLRVLRNYDAIDTAQVVARASYRF